MSKHGNSLENENPHHLYEIRDLVENDVLKYGISDDSIERDGLSKRVRSQLDFLNRAIGFLRFAGHILLHHIPGRAAQKRSRTNTLIAISTSTEEGRAAIR